MRGMTSVMMMTRTTTLMVDNDGDDDDNDVMEKEGDEAFRNKPRGISSDGGKHYSKQGFLEKSFI